MSRTFTRSTRLATWLAARRTPGLAFGLLAIPAVGCAGPPAVPVHPTWADVAPIVQGQCTYCHGSTAFTTGGGCRLDFFDMTSDVCGDAALAIPNGSILAGTSAGLIQIRRHTPFGRWPVAHASRARARAARLGADGHSARWATQPAKGAPPAGNRPPTIDIAHVPVSADQRLDFTAVLVDPDGEPVVGVIEIGGAVFAMDRSGAFSVDFDSSKWPAGAQRLSAVLCDGWTKATYDLGSVTITH